MDDWTEREPERCREKERGERESERERERESERGEADRERRGIDFGRQG